MKSLAIQFTKYFGVAAVGYVFDFGRYVFGESKLTSRRQEFLLFTLIGLVGLAILNLLMWGMTSGLHVN